MNRKNIARSGLVLLATWMMSGAAFAGLEGHLAVNGVDSSPMEPGQAARWAVSFRDAQTGQQVTGFDQEHEKFMHLIVVPADLSTFAHLHPRLESTGLFVADVNAASDDPDNQDAARAVTVGGPHFVFAEIKPTGQDDQVQRFTVLANGASTGTTPTADPLDVYGRDVKYFAADGSAAAPGADLQVIFRTAPMPGMLHLTFDMERRTSAPGAAPVYAPVDDLEPWLGMKAHAIVVGVAGATVNDRVFRHLHAGHGDHGGHSMSMKADDGLMFMMNGDDVPPQGVYRIWLQAKRAGHVLTFPFTFKI